MPDDIDPPNARLTTDLDNARKPLGDIDKSSQRNILSRVMNRQDEGNMLDVAAFNSSI